MRIRLVAICLSKDIYCTKCYKVIILALCFLLLKLSVALMLMGGHLNGHLT